MTEEHTEQVFYTTDYRQAKAHHIQEGGFLLKHQDGFLVTQDAESHRSPEQIEYLDTQHVDWDETHVRADYALLPSLGNSAVDPQLEFHGPTATHRMPCAVLGQSQNAVYNCNLGVYQPSWRAQQQGWQLVKVKPRWQWLLRLIDGKGNVT